MYMKPQEIVPACRKLKLISYFHPKKTTKKFIKSLHFYSPISKLGSYTFS